MNLTMRLQKSRLLSTTVFSCLTERIRLDNRNRSEKHDSFYGNIPPYYNMDTKTKSRKQKYSLMFLTEYFLLTFLIIFSILPYHTHPLHTFDLRWRLKKDKRSFKTENKEECKENITTAKGKIRD